MARVPEYTQEIFLDRSQPNNATSVGQIGFNKAQASLQDAQRYEDRGTKAANLGETIQTQRDAEGKLFATEQYNLQKRELITKKQEFENARLTNPTGFATDFDEFHKTQSDEAYNRILEERGDKPFDAEYFNQLMTEDRTSYFEKNTKWENDTRVKNVLVSTEQNLDGMINNFNLDGGGLKDIEAQTGKIRDYVNTAGVGLDAEQKYKLTGYAVDRNTRAILSKELQNNPKVVRDAVFYGQASKDQLVKRMMFDVEGGEKLAYEPGGGVAKFGISSDVVDASGKVVEERSGLTVEQVKALTADDAAKIYAEKYWDKRLDDMTPEMRTVAFDAIVNSGNDKDTWSQIAQAKGDPYMLIAIRRQHYKDLIASNPEKYGKYMAGWDRRMAEAEQYVVGMDQKGGRQLVKVASLLDPRVITDAQDNVYGAIESQSRVMEQQKQRVSTEYKATAKTLYDRMINDPQTISDDDMDALKMISDQSGDPVLMQSTETLFDLKQRADQLKTMNEAQLDVEEKAAKAQIGKSNTEFNRQYVGFVQDIKKNVQERIKADGIGYLADSGQIAPLMPIDFSDEGAAYTELMRRSGMVEYSLKTQGRALSPMTPFETDQFVKEFQTLPIDDVVSRLNVLSEIPAEQQQLIQDSLADKNPVLASLIGQDDPTVAKMIARGSRIDDQLYTPTDMKNMISAKLMGFELDPNVVTSLLPSVEAYYKADQKLLKKNDKTIADADLQKAIDMVVGPSVDLGKRWFDGPSNKIFSMRDPETNQFLDEDTMYNMMNGIDEDQIKKLWKNGLVDVSGREITADILNDQYNFVSAGNGKYFMVHETKAEYIPISAEMPDVRNVLDGNELLKLYRKKNKIRLFEPKKQRPSAGRLPAG